MIFQRIMEGVLAGMERGAISVTRGLILLYRYTFSLFMGRTCRFEPTCSEYALEALNQHGFLRGVYLTCRRLSRCHPWGEHGYDPVPGNKKNCHNSEAK